MLWRTKAVTTGSTSKACANTMALKEKSQPRKPSGPERDSSRYTTRPTTTEGSASAVLRKASTTPRPAKRATPSQAPSTKPRLQASTQAQALTASDRSTMPASTGSSEVMSEKAVRTLSWKVFIKAMRPRRLAHCSLVTSLIWRIGNGEL